MQILHFHNGEENKLVDTTITFCITTTKRMNRNWRQRQREETNRNHTKIRLCDTLFFYYHESINQSFISAQMRVGRHEPNAELQH